MLLALLTCSASSQSIYFRHYQVEQGLANNTVFAVYQDSRGFMWFGTKEGLNRYDGSVFKTYVINEKQKSDTREFIYCIKEGVNHTLWLGTREGIYEFNPVTERFTVLAGSQGSQVVFAQADKKGNIWFNASVGMYRYNELDRKIFEYTFKTAGHSNINSISIDTQNTILVASGNGYLYRYNERRDSFETLNLNRTGDISGAVTKILQTNDHKVAIGTTNGLGIFDPISGDYRQILGKPGQNKRVYVRDILHVSQDEIWIASESGIYSVSLSNGKVGVLRQDDLNQYSLSDNAVYTLYKDKEGGIWCGTYFGGVNYYHPQLSYFQKYFKRGNYGLSGYAVRELCADGKGNLWLGTEDGGLNKLNMVTGNIQRQSGPDSHHAYNIHGLLIDKNELWIGTFQQGLDVLNLNTNKYIRHYNADPQKNGLGSNFVISSLKTSSGQLLFGTASGVYSYNRKSDHFDLCRQFPEISYVFSLFEDSKGIIWAGTIGTGLYAYNSRTNITLNYRYNNGNQRSLSSNSVCGISEDSRQNIWLCTEGGGLCRYNEKTKDFERFNTTNGLPSNMVYKVLEDLNGNLWISTSRGLVVFNPKRKSWKVYTKTDGLLTDQFNYSSGYRDPYGNLYFGSVKGLISFNPEVIVHEKADPALYITSFQNNNRDIDIKVSGNKRAVDFADSVILPYTQSSFSIGFAALTYISSVTTSYIYRLDGLEKGWTRLSTNRKVNFSWVPPGIYKFSVRAVDSEGRLQRNERSLFIQILPPWWQSRYAYVSYLILIILTVYIIINRYRLQQRERHRRRIMLFNQEKEKEIYKAKIDFFTNVAHEIRTPLTLIKGPLEMVMDEVGQLPAVKNNLKNIEKNTERLVKLTDQLLDFRRTENHEFKLNFVKVKITKLVKENIEMFIASIQKREIELKFEDNGSPFFAFVDIEAFRKIISNLIGNAVKYAETRIFIKVARSQDERSFTIEISNDGVIIPFQLKEKIFEPFYRINSEGKQGSGIGLPLARALATLHDGTLELQANEKKLNIFLLTLPIHQKIEFQLKSLRST
jgi:signal transduction histidine kinase/ligand-binding sensor domain-containing protein